MMGLAPMRTAMSPALAAAVTRRDVTFASGSNLCASGHLGYRNVPPMPTVGCAGMRVGLDDDHIGAIRAACGGQGGLQFGAAAYLGGQGTEAARVLCEMRAPAAAGPADQIVEARVAR